MKMEEDRDTAASQHHRGMLNLEGKRILLRNSDVGQSKGVEKPLTDSFDGATPHSHVVSLGVLWLGGVPESFDLAICMVCAVAETHDIWDQPTTSKQASEKSSFTF